MPGRRSYTGVSEIAPVPRGIRIPWARETKGVLWRALGRDWTLAYALLAPAMAVLVGLIAYPFIMAFVLSLEHKAIGGEAQFVGLQNFVTLLGDPVFRQAVGNSIVYTVVAVVFKFILGLCTALILHGAVRYRDFFRVLLILPWSAPVVVGALTWRWILDDMAGVLNFLLWKSGIIQWPIPWLADPKLALWAVIMVVIWQGTPFYTLNFLAGLSAIDRSLYEAAAIDGAGATQRFFHVTLPGLRDVIVITLLLSTIWTSNNLQFVFLLTQGGPGNATQIVPMLSYMLAIQVGELGMGAAIALAFVPFLAPLVVVLTRRLLAQTE
jgi:ABC-type sugar transport system permease subunit